MTSKDEQKNKGFSFDSEQPQCKLPLLVPNSSDIPPTQIFRKRKHNDVEPSLHTDQSFTIQVSLHLKYLEVKTSVNLFIKGTAVALHSQDSEADTHVLTSSIMSAFSISRSDRRYRRKSRPEIIFCMDWIPREHRSRASRSKSSNGLDRAVSFQ